MELGDDVLGFLAGELLNDCEGDFARLQYGNGDGSMLGGFVRE